MQFEHKQQRLASRGEFFLRILGFAGISALIVAAALGVGICGYHFICEFTWIDSLLNASMILGGMGPVTELKSNAGKLFSSFYALFSGLVFVISFSVIMSPVVHRVLHKFHVDADELPTE